MDTTEQQPLHAEHQGTSSSNASSSASMSKSSSTCSNNCSSASRIASRSVSSSSSDIVVVMLVPGVDPTEQQGLHADYKGCSSIRTCE